MPTHFTPAGLRFLRALKKNNDRAWFAERKDVYETEVKAPWLAIIDEVNAALDSFAPDCVKPASRAMFRIYRDTRFSANKLPFKTHVGAWWSPAALSRTSGGGFYAHVAGDEVLVAAGVYMPQPEQLLAIRRHLEQNHKEMRALLANKRLRVLLPELDSNPLTRLPKGFVTGPADDLLLCRQWALSTRLPAELAVSPSLVNEMVVRFKAAAPMVALLNAPLHTSKKLTPRKSLF